MRYEEPYMVILKFDNNDIITLSDILIPGTGSESEEGGSSGDFNL